MLALNCNDYSPTCYLCLIQNVSNLSRPKPATIGLDYLFTKRISDLGQIFAQHKLAALVPSPPPSRTTIVHIRILLLPTPHSPPPKTPKRVREFAHAHTHTHSQRYADRLRTSLLLFSHRHIVCIRLGRIWFNGICDDVFVQCASARAETTHVTRTHSSAHMLFVGVCVCVFETFPYAGWLVGRTDRTNCRQQLRAFALTSCALNIINQLRVGMGDIMSE